MISVLLVCSLVFSVNFSFAQTYYPGGLAKSSFNLWFDVSDASTLTQAGGLVTKWSDKINGINALQNTVSKQPSLSTINGRGIVEFNGIKGMDIANNSFINPTSGYHLAQMIYVYPDAPLSVTDSRLGTFTRNSKANAFVATGLPELSVRYSAADTVYQFAQIGAGNTLFPDMRGTFSLLENYMSGATGLATCRLNGGAVSTTTISAAVSSTNPATIGNREQYYIGVHWGVNETILTAKPISIAERQILEVYLAWKWHNQNNLSGDILSLYNPTDSTFNNKVLGIGNAGATDTVLSTKSNNGLAFSSADQIKGFCLDKGQYLLAADNNGTGVVNIGSSYNRWGRSWYIGKTDPKKSGGMLNMVFDFSVYGQAAGSTTTTDYYLLYNASKGDFSSGSNFVIPVASTQLEGAKLVFKVDGNNINSGYYTIVYAAKGTPQNLITNFTPFVPTVITYNAPVLLPVYAGNTFNMVTWNVDSLSFTPVGYKIYSGSSPSSLSLIDSISVGSTLLYNHYGLTNGQKYYYAVKAISRTGNLSSTFSNLHSGTPGVYKAQWSISPQLSGLTTAIMAAVAPSQSPTLRYYFEITASGIAQNSGWVKSAAYKDSTLSTGVTTTFRVKLADSTNVNATQSGWSDSISLTAAADSVQGGYTYNWASFNNSDNNVYGLGPVQVTQDFTGTPFIKHIPPFGIHPRVFCNPEDSTTIRLQLKNTNSGRAIAKKIHAFTTLLTLGTKGSPGIFNNTPSSPYAVDSLGVYYIGTGNAFNFFNQKPTYDSLATYKNANGIGRDDNLSVLLADEAFECWLFKGTMDPVTNTSYTLRAKKLANAFSHWAAIVINDHNSNPASTKNLGGNVGLVYDFAFNFMTSAQQDTVRRAMAMLAAHSWTYNGGSDYYGLNITSYANTSNWATWGNQTLNDLAMEGEPGANTTRTITYARANWNFLTYGIYETGQPYEGMGKNELDARVLVALARRGYSMLGHPNLRAFATKYLPAITQPFGNSFVGTDLLGGFDNYYGALTTNYAAYGGWRFKGVDMVALKYIYPNDVAVDYVWKNYIKQYTADQNAKDGYYQYQSLGGQTPFFADLLAAIYPADYSSASTTSLAQAAFKSNTSYFDYRGGMAVFRSGFDQNAATLWFHNRTDIGGHAYSNKNDIMYSALGRAWMPKISTNANSNNVWCDVTKANSGILINGKGACADTGGNFMKVPGKIVYYNSTDAISSVGGDATLAYSYLWLSGGSGYAPITETRNSFQYVQSNLPYFNISFSNYPNWMNAGQNNNWVKSPYNICKKVFRTVALIKDANPYALIVDDVQKDATNNNNYKWIGQLAADLVVDSVVVNLNNSAYRNDIIFKEPSNTGNRRFLVRVLNNTGQKDPKTPGVIDNNWIPGQATRSVPRLTLESISNNPNFKVMLYAYVAGSKLPVTTWTSAAHDSLLVTNAGVTKMVYFPMDTLGRTNIFLANAPLQGNYFIVNKNSKKPVNVVGSGLKDSVFIEQNQADTVSLKWTVTSVGNGYYTIINKNSGKFMDVYRNSKSSTARIVQNTRNNLDDQLWQITERGGGFYSVSNKNSGLSLYIDSSSTKNGAVVRQGPYTGADNQLFNFNQQIDLIGGINLPVIQPDTIAPLQLQSQVINWGGIPTKTYGDVDFSPGASSTNIGIPITYTSSNTSVAVITPAGIIHIVGVGQTTITASQSGNSVYNPAASVSQTLTVMPAKLTITANNQIKTYGSTNPILTFSIQGFVNGDTTSNLSTLPTISTTASANSPVGVYPITVSGAVSINYSISYVQGTLTINAKVRNLTFNAMPAKTYGDIDFDPGAFINTADTVIYTSSNTAIATIVNGKIHIVSAGSVTITASVPTKAGYTNVLPLSQVLNINKANQVIVFNPIPVQVMGAPALALTVTSSSGLAVTLSSSDTKIATINLFNVNMVGVGSATITATQAGDMNYLPASASQVITILPAANSILPLPVVPNGFTPNGDGINDTWEILNLDKYPTCTVKVFNRSGQNVYSSIGYSSPWDGRFKNEVLPAGTYFYIIDLKNNRDILSGAVNIIK